MHLFLRLFFILYQHLYAFFKHLAARLTPNKPPYIYIYMLHNIAEKADDAYTITPRGFKAFIESIQKTIDVDEYGKSDGRYVLSFDDAFAGVYDIARPLLKEKKLKYYIFICNEYIDKAGYLSREQIKELAKDENCII